MNYRVTKNELISKTLISLLALPAVLVPAACLITILWKGSTVLSWEFVSTAGSSQGFGLSTGILPQLTGSLLLAGIACLIAAPIALGSGLYYHLLAGSPQRRFLNIILQVLQGIPPIVFGLFGLVVFVYLLDWGVSLASGSVIMACVVLPLMTLNIIAAIERLPKIYTNTAKSLGLNDFKIITRVWLPQAWAGIITGLLMAIARALSETAPILFTATIFSGVMWPDSIFSPVTTLQTHIFYIAQEGSNPEAVSVAWGSAALLVITVACFSLIAHRLKQMGHRYDS